MQASASAGGAPAGIATCVLLFIALIIPPGAGAQEGDRNKLDRALSLADGDSALAVIISAMEQDPDHPLGAEALSRAGFIAYVKGDAERAGEIFDMAREAGAPGVGLWRGLALLTSGRSEAAERSLREFSERTGAAGDRRAALALAACSFQNGEVDAGVSTCRTLLEEGGDYSAAALLLMVSIPGAVGQEEVDGWTRLISERDPLSYEAALARRASEIAARSRHAPPIEEELIPEEAIESGPRERGTPVEGGEVAEEEAVAEEGVPADRPTEDDELPFSVQVGAFADVRNAESLVGALIERGYDSVRIERETKGGSLFHCVRVGRLATRDNALALASTLQRKEGLGTSIVDSTDR